LKKAGVPEDPFGVDAKMQDRLSGTEISQLLVGHELAGQIPDKPEALHMVMGDGTAEVSLGDFSGEGTVTIEEDSYCIYFTTLWRNCHYVYRNPGGTLANKNEFLQITQHARTEFSIVK
jgi:hypothetical protein